MQKWITWVGVCLGLWLLVSPVALAQGVWPDLMREGPSVGGGKKDAAVIIGVEDYLFVPDVPGAASNALAWSRYLNRSRKVPLGKITLLTNKDATKEKINRAVEQARKDVGRGGTVWFVFIGHGAPSVDGRDGLLVGADSDQDPGSIYARSVSRDGVLASLEKGRQSHTYVILDTCFSGRDSQNNAVAAGLQPLVPLRPEEHRSKTVTVMTAGRGDQFAGPLPGAQRPAFSYLLLGALWGWADEDQDGAVTEQEARDYVAGNLRFLLQGKRAQTPELWSVNANRAMVKARDLARGPDIYQIASRLVGAQPIEVGNAGGGDFKVDGLRSEVVAFASEPSGAAVLVDGKLLCQATPCSRSLEHGAHSVEMSGDCFQPARANFQVQPGKAQEVRLQMQDKPSGIEVRVADGQGNALRARVFVDGRELGQSPNRFPVGVCARQLTITAEGFQSWSSPLKLTERKVSTFQVTLKEDRARRAQQEGMVRIPAGSFTMGATRNNREKPVRSVYLDEFYIDKFEVTVDDYAACVRARGCTAPKKDHKTSSSYNWNAQGRGRFPINGVDWSQAQAYCKWKGKRLPTEAEWEKAARGTDARQYPWGNQPPSCALAQTKGCTPKNTSEVGAHPGGVSPYGVHDMAGNVWEWVADYYKEDAYKSQPSRNPKGPSSGTKRGLRGGSWGIDHVYLRAAHRNAITPLHVGNDLGIRCAR